MFCSQAGAAPQEILCPDGKRRKCVIRLAFWIADTPEKSKLMLTHGHKCNICEAGKNVAEENLNQTLWSDIGHNGFAKQSFRCVDEARALWRRAAKAYTECEGSHSKPLDAAKAVMAEKSLKFSKTEPILYNLPGFGFQSLAFEEMHTLEGISKWVITFTLNALQKQHPRFAPCCKRIDSLAKQASGAPFLI
jgi:hypothetical protein